MANRDSGSITTVNLEARSIVGERKVGQQLSCLTAVPGSTRFLATDEQANELLLVDPERILTRVPVAESPVKVIVSPDGRQAVVASLWSRRLSFVTIDGKWLEVNKVIPLAFSPRELCFLEQDRIVVVADAFGGHLAVFSTTDTNLRVSQRIPGHNIGGLVAHPEEGLLAISHQRLRSVANISIGDIHWGNLLGNHLRFLNLKDVHVMSRSLMRDGWLDDLGGPSNGAGDPGAMAVTPSGHLVTCLSGAHAVEIISPNVADSVRGPVGRGPVAISVVPETNLVVAANRFSDSLTLLDVPAGKVVETISLSDDAPSPTRSQQGEALFHDATLSLDGWMSCHSCHTDGHSSGELADTLSDGHYTTPKRYSLASGCSRNRALGMERER